MQCLPKDILFLICKQIDDLRSLSRLARTCHMFNEIVIGNNFSLWKKFAKHYQKNDLYNWRTVFMADRMERSVMDGHDLKLFSPSFLSVTFKCGRGEYIYHIRANHPNIRDMILKKYEGSIGYDSIVLGDDQNVSGLIADLITNYGFTGSN